MSKTIDNRVVSMEFDNAKFERNVKQSMDTLSNLDKRLNNLSSVNPFESLSNAARKFDLSGIGDAVDAINQKFSYMHTFFNRIIERMADSAYNWGKNLVKSLSIDQITAGWQKYESVVDSTKTIMGSMPDMSEAEVLEQIEKLNRFADETSYSLTDMTSNVGKFVAQGVDLDKAVIAMQGIATWAAKSGQESQEASRAMYNMSQALGVGAVTTIDWKSIENANMATKEFKQTAIETAEELGILEKKADGVWQIVGTETEVSIAKFRESLSEKWFTSDVLMAALTKYGEFAVKIDELYEAAGEELTVSEWQEIIGKYANDKASVNLEELAKRLKDTGMTADDLRQRLDYLTSSELQLGRDAYLMAQQATTFKQAIEATKDAVSTRWIKIFEQLIGTYEDTRVIFTDLSNYLYGVFTDSLWEVFEVLKVFNELGGHSILWNKYDPEKPDNPIGLMYLLGDAASAVVQPIKDAWEAIFPYDRTAAAEKLVSVLTNARDAIKSFIDSFTVEVEEGGQTVRVLNENNKTAVALRDAFKGLFSIVKFVINGFKLLVSVGKDLYKRLKPVFSFIIDVVGKTGKAISGIVASMEKLGVFDAVLKLIKDFLDPIEEFLTDLGLFKSSDVDGFFKKLVEWVTSALSAFVEWSKETGAFKKAGEIVVSILKFLIDGFKKVKEWVKDAFENGLKPAFKWLSDNIVNKVWPVLKSFWEDTLKPFLKDTKEKLGDVFSSIKTFISNSWPSIKEVLDTVWNFIKNTAVNIWEALFGKKSEDSAETHSGILTKVKDALVEIGKFIANAGITIWELLFGKKHADTAEEIEGELDDITGKVDSLNALGDSAGENKGIVGFFNRIKDNVKAIGESEAWKSFVDFLNGIWEGLKKIGAWFATKWEAVSPKIKEFFNSLSLEDILKIVKTGALLILALSFKKTGDAIGGMFGSIGGLIDAITDKLGGGKATILEQIGDFLKSFALSILFVVGALFLFSQLDSKKIPEAIDLLVSVFKKLIGSVIGFIAALIIISKTDLTNGTAKILKNLGKFLISLAVSIFIIIFAVKKMLDIMKDYKKVRVALEYVIEIIETLGEAAALMALAAAFGKKKASVLAVVALAASVFIVLAAIKKAIEMINEYPNFEDGLEKVIIILAALAICAGIMGAFKFKLSNGLGIILLIAAMSMMINRIVKLAKQLEDFDDGSVFNAFDRALLVFGGLMVGLIIFAGVAGLAGKKLLAAAAGVLIIAIALAAVVGAVELLYLVMSQMGPTDAENVFQMFISIAASMIILSAVVGSLGLNVLKGAAGLLVMAIAFAAFVGVVELLYLVLDQMSIFMLDEVLEYLKYIAIAVGVMAIIAGLFNSKLASGGVGIALIAAGFTAIIAALALLVVASQSIDPDKINALTLLLGVILGVITIMVAILEFSSTTGGVQLRSGGGIALMAAGITAIVLALSALIAVSSISDVDTIKSLTGLLSAIIGIMTLMVAIVSFTNIAEAGISLKAGGAVALMAVGIAAIVLSMTPLIAASHKVSEAQIKSITGLMSAVLGIMTAMILVMSINTKFLAGGVKSLAGGGGIAIMAIGVAAVALALGELIKSTRGVSTDNIEAITGLMAAVLGVMTALAVVAGVAGPRLLAGGGGVAIMAVGIGALVIALAGLAIAMKDLNPDQIKATTGQLAAVLGIIVALEIVAAIGGLSLLAGSFGVLVMAAAMAILIFALGEFAKVIKNEGIEAAQSALDIFVKITEQMLELAVVSLVLCAPLLIIGAAVILVGIGLLLVASAFGLMMEAMSPFMDDLDSSNDKIESFTKNMEALGKMLTGGGVALLNGLVVGFIEETGKAVKDIVDAIVEPNGGRAADRGLLWSVGDSLKDAIQGTEGAVGYIAGIIWGGITHLPDAIAAGFSSGVESYDDPDGTGASASFGEEAGIALTDAMYDAMVKEAEDRHQDLETAIELTKNDFNDYIMFSDPSIQSIGETIISYMHLGIKEGFDLYNDALSNAFDRIKKIFKECLGIGEDGVSTVFYGYGKNIIQGLKNGLYDNQSIVTNQVEELAVSTKSRFAELMAIKSPSGVFEYLGNMLTQGLKNGITNGIPDIMTSMSDLAKNGQTSFTDAFNNGSDIDTDSLVNSLSGSLSSISIEDLFGGSDLDFASLFGGDIDIDSLLAGEGMDFSSMFDLDGMDFSSLFGDLEGYSPTITPVLDDSNITSGMFDIQSLFNSSNFSIGGGNLDFMSSFIKDDSGNNMISQLLAEMKGVNANITGLREENGNTQIIMDSGELVGVMDRGLGSNGSAARRSVAY